MGMIEEKTMLLFKRALGAIFSRADMGLIESLDTTTHLFID